VILASTLLLLVFPCAFLYLLLRRRRWSLRLWLMLPVFCMLFLAAMQLPLDGSRPGFSSALSARFALALMGLPTVAYLLVVAVCTYQHRWATLMKWILAVVILSGIIVAVGFSYDAGYLEDGVRYTWHGWSLPLFMAVNAVGIAMLLILPIWYAAGYLWRFVARRERAGV
jgi:hypothetical protein